MSPDNDPAASPERGRRRREIQHAVDRAVAAEDPEGVLSAGAPADEYSPEVQALVGLVLGEPVTADRVVAVWEHWFGPGSGLVRSPERLERLTASLTKIQRHYSSAPQ